MCFVELVDRDQLDFTAAWASAGKLPGRRRGSSSWLRNEAVTENSLPANRLQFDLFANEHLSRTLCYRSFGLVSRIGSGGRLANCPQPKLREAGQFTRLGRRRRRQRRLGRRLGV